MSHIFLPFSTTPNGALAPPLFVRLWLPAFETNSDDKCRTGRRCRTHNCVPTGRTGASRETSSEFPAVFHFIPLILQRLSRFLVGRSRRQQIANPKPPPATYSTTGNLGRRDSRRLGFHFVSWRSVEPGNSAVHGQAVFDSPLLCCDNFRAGEELRANDSERQIAFNCQTLEHQCREIDILNCSRRQLKEPIVSVVGPAVR